MTRGPLCIKGPVGSLVLGSDSYRNYLLWKPFKALFGIERDYFNNKCSLVDCLLCIK